MDALAPGNLPDRSLWWRRLNTRAGSCSPHSPSNGRWWSWILNQRRGYVYCARIPGAPSAPAA